MRKRGLLAAAFLAAVVLISSFATGAYGFTGETRRCSTCHSGGGVTVAATETSNDGQTATFDVVVTGGNEWAVFNGTTRIDGAASTTGQFAVPTGFTYTVFAVDAPPETNGLAQISVSPVVPVIDTTYTVTPSAGANGSISPSTQQVVVSGGDVTFNITANTGFHIADVLVDGASVGASATVSFTNVVENHTLSATFAANPVGTFTILATSGSGGSISPSGEQIVTSGDSLTFTITPDLGFHTESVLVDGLLQSPVPGTYTFTNVTANHTILVTFSDDIDVLVPTSITLRSSDYSIRRYKLITLSSVLSSEDDQESFLGSPVRYEVKRPGSHTWVFLQTRIVDADGASHTSRRKLSIRGTYQFRVRYLGNDDALPSTSRTVKVVVR